MAKAYVVTNTVPHTYIDVNNRPINGTKVYFTILKHNEGFDVDVPDMNDTAFVEKRINEVVVARDKLAALGS